MHRAAHEHPATSITAVYVARCDGLVPQDTFDEAVRENIEEFDMTVSKSMLCTYQESQLIVCLRLATFRMQPEEAVQSAVEEFGAQVTLDMIARQLRLGAGLRLPL